MENNKITKVYQIVGIVVGIFIILGIIATIIFNIWQIKNKEDANLSEISIIPYSNSDTNYCDSDFINDNKWEIDNHWIRDKNNPQRFIAKPDSIKGGPKMTYKNIVSDNFRLTLNFSSIKNENANNNEIGLVIYVGDLYQLVLGDGNKGYFYIKNKKNEYVDVINKNISDTKRIPLPNEISFNKWTQIEIRQSVMVNSETRNIIVTFYYTPAELKNAQPIITDPPYIFQLSDDSFPEKVSRKIAIGLRYSENIITTEFYCFKLEDLS